MKTEIEQIKEEMKLLSDRLEKALKQETKFEVGKWYKRGRELLVWNNGDYTYGFNSHGGWSSVFLFGSLDGAIPATKEEIESVLIAEAKKRGFKEGVIAKLNGREWYQGNENYTYYDNNETHYPDSLQAGCIVCYQNGQWAEIISEPKIMIDRYEVKFHFRGYTEIDGNKFTKEFWQAAKVISEHSKACVNIGCSHQFKVDLKTINQILNKL